MRLDRGYIQRGRPIFYASNRSIEQFKSSLRIGQILKGRVLYILDDRRSLIRFRGFNVVTESQERLFRGQLVTARVIEIGDKVIMRIVRDGAAQGEQGNVMQVVSVDEILEDIGITPDRFTRSLVEAMIRYNMPIRPDLVESMSVFLMEIGRADMAEAVVLAKLIGLPLHQSLISALNEVIKGDIGGMISRLQRIASDLPAAETQMLYNLLEEISVEGFPRLAGLNYENLLMRAAVTGESPPQELRETLKGIILRLMEGGDLPDRVLAELESILRNLEGQQLLNLPREPVRYDLPIFFLQVPVRFEDEFKTVYIKAYPDSEGKLSPESMKLDLLFETQNMGKIRVSLMMVERKMTIRTWVENEEVRGFIEKSADDLISRIEEMRYQVDLFSCEVNPRRVSSFEILPPETSALGEQKRVNIMA
jgi:hypothetical protein